MEGIDIDEMLNYAKLDSVKSFYYTMSVSVNGADVVVLLELLGIGIVLSLVASAASVIFITRHDPLKILSNRD